MGLTNKQARRNWRSEPGNSLEAKRSWQHLRGIRQRYPKCEAISLTVSKIDDSVFDWTTHFVDASDQKMKQLGFNSGNPLLQLSLGNAYQAAVVNGTPFVYWTDVNNTSNGRGRENESFSRKNQRAFSTPLFADVSFPSLGSRYLHDAWVSFVILVPAKAGSPYQTAVAKHATDLLAAISRGTLLPPRSHVNCWTGVRKSLAY